MATTTGGSTYVVSTDLVADYPTASLALANRVDVVASGSMSKKTASYTVTVADILAGTTIVMNSASATVLTLPSTSLVNGMRLNAFSVNTGAVTFTGGTVTGTVNSITSQYSGVSLTYDSAAAVWWCLPFSSGASAANFTNVATGTYTGYKYVSFTGNGSLVIDKAGYADVLVQAGGGGLGGNGTQMGGGGAGQCIAQNIYLAAATYAVTVGAGGGTVTTIGGQGSNSSIGTTVIAGGGGGGFGAANGIGNVFPTWSSGGGHAGGIVIVASGTAARNGMGSQAGGANEYTGTTSSITGSAVTYGIGGSAAAPTAAGSGGWTTNGVTGIVIVRVAV
jgi:hypothetical protein